MPDEADATSASSSDIEVEHAVVTHDADGTTIEIPSAENDEGSQQETTADAAAAAVALAETTAAAAIVDASIREQSLRDDVAETEGRVNLCLAELQGQMGSLSSQLADLTSRMATLEGLTVGLAVATAEASTLPNSEPMEVMEVEPAPATTEHHESDASDPTPEPLAEPERKKRRWI